MKTVTIHISAEIGTGYCVNNSDAHIVHDMISKEISVGNRVVLSFSGITRVTTAFLNVAIGQLYGQFSEVKLRMHMAPPIDADPSHLSRLKLVVDRAKLYFQYRDAVNKINVDLDGSDNE